MKKIRTAVSVPLRGFCFLIIIQNGADMVFQSYSFRPLTGILFFNKIKRQEPLHKPILGFRPLTGVLFFNAEADV